MKGKYNIRLNKILLKLILSLSIVSAVAINSKYVSASDVLVTIPWPTKNTTTNICKNCAHIEVYTYHITLRSHVSDIAMFEGLGLQVTTIPTNKTKSKIFSFGIPHKSILPSLKEKFKHINITINSWTEYHQLLAKKSSNKTIESLRSSLDITKAKHYYKYVSKKTIKTKSVGKKPTPFTAFYVEQTAPILSSVIILPNNSNVKPNSLGALNVLPELLIKGTFSKSDVELILNNL